MIQTHRIESNKEADAYLVTLLKNGVGLSEIRTHAFLKIPDPAIRAYFLKSAEAHAGNG